jgi:hypothetical protein
MRTNRNTVECRSCGAPIVFLTTSTGKRMPVEADSVSPGDTEFEPSAGHESHFANCPNADGHRGGR